MKIIIVIIAILIYASLAIFCYGEYKSYDRRHPKKEDEDNIPWGDVRP